MEGASDKWMVVGLGNPGENYRHTRHNVGFRAVECLVEKHGVRLQEKWGTIFGAFSLGGKEVFLLFPQTFMNDSGRAVAPFLQYRNLGPSNLLVVLDDLDLAVGKLRVRPSGSSGGHHGLDSIIAHLGSQAFPRVRVGIGKPPVPQAGADYVLSAFTPEEAPVIGKMLVKAADCVESWILEGPETAMQKFNGNDL